MSITLQVGNRVEVTGKNVQGEIAYIGTTMFASGKWIGIILDEPKGKNNGTVQGKSYFQCKENHGVFVRQSQLTLVTDTGSRIDLSGMSSSVTSPDDILKTTPKSRLTSSRQSLSGKNRDSRSREDMSSSTTSLIPEPTSKRASFIEPPKLRSPMGRSGTPNTPRRPTKTLIPTSEKKKQTGFVETLNPQFTPGEVVSTPVTPSLVPVQAPRLLQPEPNPEMESLREQIKDLTEKLETMRMKYKEKSHDLDAIRIQLDQSAEFKARIMESQAALKKELERAKRERQEALEEREEYSELADTLEMATLDKEMAEEKAESLHKELEQANERIEELEMELEGLKVELAEKFEGVVSTDNTSDPQVSLFKLKQMEQQNEKLKETLVRLRDLSAHEKHEKQKLLKDFDDKKNELEQLTKHADKLKTRLAEMEEEISELHSNVDAALGAEEMVETLGQQKLSLEEKVKELEEAVAELEELQEVNDQLQEGFKEQEQDFRQELDLKNLQVWEAQRKTESVLESLADRELTIVKFRELVQRMQEENQELRSQLESSTKTTVATSVPEFLEFKKMFAETKAHARAIDLELRHMEVQQAQLHVQYLVAFMPDSFLTRGGDNDAVLIVLLMPRLLTKCQVLLTQLRDKYPAVDTVQRATLNHSVHQFAARSRFAMLLHMLQSILRQFVHGLNTCTPETLLKVGASYPDMAQQEKLMDGYIDLLKRDQLDENVSTENLERIIAYFNTVHPAVLLVNGETEIHQGQLLSDLGKALLCGVDSINTDAAIIQVLIQSGDSSTDVVALCQQIASWCETARQHLRQVRRRLDLLTDLQGLGDLVQVCYTVLKMAKILAETAKASMAQVPSTTDSESLLPPKKVLDQLTQSYDKYAEDDKEKGVIAYLKLGMESVSMQIANTALTLQENEEKFMASKDEKSREPPLALRARAVKQELNATGGLRKQLEHRESDIRELKMTLRNKQEELGEISLRRDIAEKKLANITKEHELTVETLKRKLEESHQQLKRKEKEFEETMDHLQKDIDSLEMEKGELKDKLKNYPKKSIDIVKSGPTSLVGEHQGSLKVIESPLLVSEIRFLKSALKQERLKRTSLEAKHYLEILDRLGPIHVPKKVKPSDEELNRINELTKKVLTLQRDMLQSLPKVVDISKKKPGIDSNMIEQHILRENLKSKELNLRLAELQVEVMNEVIKQKKGGFIQTDLAVFPTPEMVKAVQEQDPVLVCEVIVPTVDPSLSGKIIPLEVNMKSLDLLKQKLFSLGP